MEWWVTCKLYSEETKNLWAYSSQNGIPPCNSIEIFEGKTTKVKTGYKQEPCAVLKQMDFND